MRIGLALGGGGARALAHIGVLKALEDAHINIDCIVGTSMGGLIGALYCLNPQALQVEETFKKVLEENKEDFFSLKKTRLYSSGKEKRIFFEKYFDFVKDLYFWNLRVVKTHLVNPDAFVGIIEEIFKEKEFSDCQLPFSCMAADIISGSEFTLSQGSLARAVIASCSLPGVFPPVEFEGRMLVDGGVLSPLPTETLKDKVDLLIGSDASQEMVLPSQIKNVVDVLFAIDKMRYQKILINNKKVADFLLQPRVNHFLWNDFNHTKEIIDLGYEETMNQVGQINRLKRRKRIVSWLPFKLFR